MLRGGIIGFGRMGVTHAAILNQHPEVQLAAVTDPSKFILSTLRRYAPLETFNDASRMMREAQLDFVVVCTPTSLHGAVAKEAAGSKLHVFMEKPLAVTFEEGRSMTEAVAVNKVVNQVGYFLRMNEVFEAVKTHLDAGLLGRVVHYKNEMYGRTVIRAWKSGWRGDKAKGGGAALDYASHAIDLSHFLFGKIAKVTGSVLEQIYSKGVEDAVYSMLHHDSGTTGNLIVNWSDETYRRPFNRVEIHGTQGKVIADRQEYKIYLKEPHPEAGLSQGWNVRYLTDLAKGTYFELRGSEYTNQLGRFVRSMINPSIKPVCTFEEALHTDQVIEQIFDDSQS